MSIDRTIIHAMLDVLLDDAQVDLNNNFGISLQVGNAPDFGLILAVGSHCTLSPGDIVKSMVRGMVRATGGIHTGHEVGEQVKARIAAQLQPKPPTKN